MREQGIFRESYPDPRGKEDLSAFEVRLESFEKNAREKCRHALKGIDKGPLPGRLSYLLEKEIFPLLFTIGFDARFTRTIFNASGEAWQSLRPISDHVRVISPVLSMNIREVREGVLRNSKNRSKARSGLNGLNAETVHLLVNRTMHPVNLFSALDGISLSWIILPRAYDLLRRDDSYCILHYLKFLCNESEPEFVRILARIITEFVGNYSLKYLDDACNRERMIDALFHGYEAMFWKNLRHPPARLEDGLVFENFLLWARMVHRRFGSSNAEMQKAIEDMEMEKEKTFPVYNAFDIAQHGQYNVHRFLVVLRHGIHGVKAVLRYLGTGPPLLKDRTDGRVAYTEVPKVLSVLLRDIRERYAEETERTRKSIRECLTSLGAVYDRKQSRNNSVGDRCAKELRFVGPRVQGLIRDLRESLAF